VKAWCRTCQAERQAKAFSRNPADWACKECGTFLTAMPKQRKPIARGRSKKPVMRPEVCAAMVAWARAGECAVCRRADCQPVLGHHVLHQQWIVSRARTLGWDPVPLLEDRRGWLRVGDPCHQRHHNAKPRIARAVLVEHCPDVFAFAAELGLSLRIEQTYPDVARAAA
jgi:hypothetical protein